MLRRLITTRKMNRKTNKLAESDVFSRQDDVESGLSALHYFTFQNDSEKNVNISAVGFAFDSRSEH